MRIRPWQDFELGVPVGLCQEREPSSEWPYQPDWILTSVKLDTVNRVYWVSGSHRESGESFFWGLEVRPLSWRYVFSEGCFFSTGRHVDAPR